jgi:hypothetical protein
MRKGEVSQIFVYIMTGIIIVSVLGFGAKMLLGLKNTAEQINCINFKQDLKERINKDMSYGVIDNKPMRVGCDVKSICFVDLGQSVPPWPAKPLDPLIEDSWSSKTKQNVFLLNDITEDFHYVEGITVSSPDYIVCKNVTNGYIKIRIEGLGDSVIIS